ncbi:1-aminocyclopropane-1-carboxylate deaminase/D-cysteine desulfhydrase [Oscillibacter sp.]|uniref:1-aminocyclopropane-1-carboxylate deaminase/D-cysteine desulfhydrase n=1 Tax=Oscillibacter sp. TaxID=1945593 RepID=UPI0026349E66|nr:D-cysteine desulfhydrase family protein [Oscillibacter sp.]MDD3347020.1 D-cysteine desulfhydrase family protein [Oscillibacter sp.]
MQDGSFPDRVSLGVFPTPLCALPAISARYGRNIWMKRDDLCGVALGGNKVRKLQYLLAQAKSQGCDTVFTTGGAQSNHAMLTAACASRLGMQCILLLKQRGVTELRGNLVLDALYGAQVRLIDTDRYEDIYDEMDRLSKELAARGHRAYSIPVGGSTPLGAIGYVDAVEELAEQCAAQHVPVGHIVSATGSGGTTAGLLLGAKRYLPGVKVTGMGVDDSPFAEIVPTLAKGAAEILGWQFERTADDFEMIYHVGQGYAVPNAEDTPFLEELARTEGILLDPVYTGKAWAGMLKRVQSGGFSDRGDIVFVHTGGAAALFAMDLPRA